MLRVEFKNQRMLRSVGTLRMEVVPMMQVLRRVVGFVAGLFIGAIVNSGLLSVVHRLIPLPDGVDGNSIESIRANIASYGPEQFIGPFVAHAGGTLVAALLATLLGGYRGKFAGLAIGVLFLTGGISMVVLLPETPLWFVALDLVVAYIPMGWLGWKLADRIRDGRAKNAATQGRAT